MSVELSDEALDFRVQLMGWARSIVFSRYTDRERARDLSVPERQITTPTVGRDVRKRNALRQRRKLISLPTPSPNVVCSALEECLVLALPRPQRAYAAQANMAE
jgi:hypothetical protein